MSLLSTKWSTPPKKMVWCLACLGSFTWALAEETVETVDLGEVVVTGEYHQKMTGGKVGSSLKETPHAVTVLTEKQLQEQNLRSLDDVMQASAGVTVQPFQLLTTAYYARGFKIDTFSQNGVPVLMGNMASAPQDMGMYEKVEILRGANGLLQGTGNPAATVNLVPKRAKDYFSLQGSLAYGRWNRVVGDVDINVPITEDGRWRARWVSGLEDKDFFYDVAKQKSQNHYGIMEYDLNDQATVYLGAAHQKIRSVTNMAGVPFYANGQDMHLPRKTYLDVDWDRFDWDNTRVFAGLDYQFDNGWEAKANYNHFTGRSYLDYAGATGQVDPVTGKGLKLTGGSYQFKNKQDSVDVYAKGTVQWGKREHELLVGGQYQQSKTEQFSAMDFNLPDVEVDPWHWHSGSVAKPHMGNYASRGPDTTKQWGVYGTGRFAVSDNVKVILGGRLSQWQLQSGNGQTAKINNELTPYGGLVWSFLPEWSAYASYSEIFQPQTQKTHQEQLLKPIRGNNLEAGIKGELMNGRLNVGVSAYQITQSNRAQEDPSHPCASRFDNSCYIADGKVRSRGVEVEVTGKITPDWNITASYSLNNSKYLKDAQSEGQSFASFAPKHIVRLWSNHVLPMHDRKISVGVGMRAQSDFSVSSGGVTLKQGGYALVDAKLAYQFDKNWEAALNISNVFDRRYYQSLSGVNWNNRYGESRAAMLTIRASFK